MNVGILGTGHYLPEKVLTNADLEKMVDTSDEWIQTRTGIKERRIAPDHIDASDMAYFAAKDALEEAGVAPEEIDLIIAATVTADTPFPGVSSLIQARLGATKAATMDVSAACTGFVYALVTGEQFIKTGAFEKVLVIGVDKLSKILD